MIPPAALCGWCDEPLQPGDRTVGMNHLTAAGFHIRPWHWECEVRSVLGGVNHQLGRCRCCGGTDDPDPPELSKREAAIRAAQLAGARRE